MQELKHSLFDFPDDPSKFDWKNEALLFYHYMLEVEDKSAAKITKLFEEYKKSFYQYRLLQEEQKKREESRKKYLLLLLLLLDRKDNKFPRAINSIVLISKVFNKLELELDKILYGVSTITEDSIINPENKEFLVNQLDKLEELTNKCFDKAKNEAIRIVRTESWRYVNERRLEEFLKKGYKYKTTYPVKDDRTGDDSWFYYDIRQVKPVHEPFSYVWEGVTRTFMTPPDRPNDRNILI